MNHAGTLAQLARYVLRPSNWGPETEAAARLLPADTPEYNAAWLRAEVEAGRAKVCDIERDGVKSGWVVFTVTDASELVIMAAFGRDNRTNLTAELARLAESLARQCECRSIRFHTMRPGLIQKAQACGFHVSEIVMRKTLQ